MSTILVPENGAIRRVTLPEAGEYRDPETGFRYHLNAGMGSHVGPGYAMTGWPVFWERLVPVEPGDPS